MGNATGSAMPTEDRLTINERWEVLGEMQERYGQAGRKERTRLLDEMQTVTELHGWSLIRLIEGYEARRPRSRQRFRTYDESAAGWR